MPWFRYLVLVLLLSALSRAGEDGPTPRADLHGDPLPAGAIARMGTTRFRTCGQVNTIAVSPDGHTLAWGGENGLTVVEAATGKILFSAHGRGGEEESIYALDFSPDGQQLTAGGDLGDLDLWNTKDWQVRRLKGHQAAIKHAAFSRDGRRVATSDNDGVMIVWDVAQGAILRKFHQEEQPVGAVAFSADGLQLACGTTSGRLLLLDAQTCEKRGEVEGHGESVVAVAFSPDGRLLASAGENSEVHVWNAQDLRPVWAGEAEGIGHLAFSKDGTTLFTADAGGYVRLWDVTSGQERKQYLVRAAEDTGLSALAVSPDARTFYGASDTPHLIVVDAATGQPLSTGDGHIQPPGQLVFSFDSRSLASSSNDGTVRVWDVATGRQKFVRSASRGQETRPAFSLDDKRLAYAGLQTVHICDAETGIPLAFGRGSPTYARNLICAPDGKGLLSLDTQHMLLWSFEDGRKLPIGAPVKEAEAGGDPSPVLELKSVFDQRTLLVVDNEVWCMDVLAGKKFKPEDFDLAPGPVSVSPDGRWMAGRSADGLAIWESASFHKMLKLNQDADASGAAMAFSLDNRWLVVCSTADRRALLLDTFTGREAGKLDAGSGLFVSAATSPDGRWLALGHSDTSILLFRWDELIARAGPPKKAADARLDAAYQNLAGEPDKAFEAIGQFLSSGAEAVAYLDGKLKPAQADRAALDQLVKDLNHDDFAVREKTTETLLGLGLLAEPHLRKALDETTALEVRKRLETVLKELTVPLIRSKELLRNLRGIGILENIGSPEAQALLEKLAAGREGSVEGEAVRAALKRLTARKKEQ